MDRAVYERMNDIEDRHWWFVARRDIISGVIGRFLSPDPKARILEAGCGTGGNLAMLAKFGAVDAFEYDEDAQAAARAKSRLDIRFGALPQDVPFADRDYNVIGLFDVLEHVEADSESLAALAERLAPGGRIIMTVPAFPFLWSRHDERHHHFRRYTRSSLAEAAQRAGLRVTYSTYFNTLLFPVALGLRAIKSLTGSETPDDQVPSGWLNALLMKTFRFERHLVGRLRLPVGLSLAAVLEKA